MFSEVAINQFSSILETQWFLPNLLPKGKLVFLQGPTGVGKSIVAAHLATLVDQQLNPETPDKVIWLTHPENAATHARYLAQQQANRISLHVIDPVLIASYGNEAPTDFQCSLLYDTSFADGVLVVVDSLEDLCPAFFQLDLEAQQSLLREFEEHAEKFGITYLFLHQDKRSQRIFQLSNRLNRFTLEVKHHGQNTRLLNIIKSQFGPSNLTHVLEFNETGELSICELTADEPMPQSRKKPGPASSAAVIVQKLSTLLTEPALVCEVRQVLQSEGYTPNAIRQALKQSKVATVKKGKDWWYQLASGPLCNSTTRQLDNMNLDGRDACEVEEPATAQLLNSTT